MEAQANEEKLRSKRIQEEDSRKQKLDDEDRARREKQ